MYAVHSRLSTGSELPLSSRVKSQSSERLALQKIAPLIHEIRGERVILDSDLAGIYDVPVKALNQAVKRNTERFPEDFAFRLTQSEFESLRSQIVTSNLPSNRASSLRSQNATASLRSQFVTLKRGQHRKYLPHAFTEHGAIMAANVLNSKQAVQMSVFVVRAFVKLRDTLATHKDLAEKLTGLERKVGTHGRAIVSILGTIRQMTEPAGKKSRAIGFRVKRGPRDDNPPGQYARRAPKK